MFWTTLILCIIIILKSTVNKTFPKSRTSYTPQNTRSPTVITIRTGLSADGAVAQSCLVKRILSTLISKCQCRIRCEIKITKLVKPDLSSLQTVVTWKGLPITIATLKVSMLTNVFKCHIKLTTSRI